MACGYRYATSEGQDRPCNLSTAHLHCPSCGLANIDGSVMCGHHTTAGGDDWAAGNRIMCALFHRKEVPKRLASSDRDDNFWAGAAEAC